MPRIVNAPAVMGGPFPRFSPDPPPASLRLGQPEGFPPMSRIGRKPVVVPANVKVSVADSTIDVEGPKGKLSLHPPARDRRQVRRRASRSSSPVRDDERLSRALHGLTRSLIANMVEGVSKGYTKKLEIVGVGYQAQLKKANTVALQVGYANQVVLEAPRRA